MPVPCNGTAAESFRERIENLGHSNPQLMLTLCLACRAKVTRPPYVQDDWHEFLLVLWREQHPDGHEQVTLNFAPLLPVAKAVPLFEGLKPPRRRRHSG